MLGRFANSRGRAIASVQHALVAGRGGRLPCGAAAEVAERVRHLYTSRASQDGQAGSADGGAAEVDVESRGWISRVFGKHNAVASPSFTNRWAIVAPAFATHLCIGSPYAWSVVSGPLSREYGFVASAADDWSLSSATMPLSIVFAMQGISAALMGKWQMRVGPRAAMSVAAACFGGGMALGGLGVAMHSLPLLYAGYGLLGGVGVGLAYTPPVQALIRWFPDRRGLASGMTIAGFGSGALLFTPVADWLMRTFSKMPTYLGPAAEVATKVRDGRMFAEVDGALREVVVATGAELAKLPYEGLAEGVYLVGSGSTGAAAALGVMGTGYLATMLASAFAIRSPHPSYAPAGWTPPAASDADGGAAAPARNVHPDAVMRTPQFWMLGTTFFCLATGGMGMFSVAKPMMTDVFSGALPSVVTAGFASAYLLMLSGGNLGGRLAWALFSDKYGRRRTFQMFTAGSLPLYLGVPFLIDRVVDSESVLPLYGFVASSVLAMSFMGATYAVMPAYESDLFGTKYVGATHGRMLLASTAASLAGPSLLFTLRSQSHTTAMHDLLARADPDTFQRTFGATIDSAQQMMEAKSLTIPKLMAIMPSDVPDPTPYLYNSTMYSMAGLMGVAMLSHAMVRPVDPKYWEREEGEEQQAAAAAKKEEQELVGQTKV